MAAISNLRVSPDQVDKAATNFETDKSDIENTIKRMIEEINEVKGVWTGDAANAFTAKVTELEADMTKLSNTITEKYINPLRAIASTYDTAESANQSDASSLTLSL